MACSICHPPSAISNMSQFAGIIAMAAEALGAASGALSEVVKAMLDASQALSNFQPFPTSDSTPSTNPEEGERDVENHSRTAVREYLGQEGPHDVFDSLKDPQVERSAETTTTPHIETLLTDDQVTVTPRTLTELGSACVSSTQIKSNNKPDALPLSPRSQSQDLPRTHSPLQTEEAEGTHSALVSCSAEIKGCDVRYSSADVASIQDKVRRNELASGRHWIRFHQKLDGASFMAYMALQNIKTVCIISNQKSLMSAYAKALESITKFTVFHPTNPGCLQLTDPLVQSFITSASPAILLLSPDRPLEISLMDLHMDCVVYWGMPWSAEYYRSRVLACSPLNIPACLILTTPGVGLDPESYGTIEYPVAFLKSISGPFKNVRDTTGTIIKDFELRRTTSADVIAVGRNSEYHATPLQGHSLAPVSDRNWKAMPPGHYFIAVDAMHDLDVIPLIAYIALNSKKVMCYLPGDKQIEAYQKQLDTLATVNAIVAPGKGKARLQMGIDQLRSSRYGILLRHTGGDLGQSFTRDLADCLIYFGLPANPSLHARTVSAKVSHSYLIFADPKRTGLPHRLSSMNPSLQEHPFLQDPADTVDGPTLYDLRVRLLCSLLG